MSKENIIEIIQLIKGEFSIPERLVFITLIKLSVDREVVITMNSLKEHTSLGTTTIYTALKTLQLKNYILKLRKDTFKIMEKGMDYIVELFEVQNKQNIA